MKKEKDSLKKYLRLYKKSNLFISKKELRLMVSNARAQAEKKYRKLSKPKLCSLSLYVKIWIRRVINKDIVTKRIQEFSPNSPLLGYKAQIKFYDLIPRQMIIKYERDLFSAEIEERKNLWKSFNIPVKDLEKLFQKMVEEKQVYAENKGFSSYIQLFLDKYQISNSSYKYFIKNIEELISFLNKKLPCKNDLPQYFYSKFNIPCVFCIKKTFPFKTVDEFYRKFLLKHNFLNKFKDKIEINDGSYSKTYYDQDKDVIIINLDKSIDYRQKIADLIHELGHLVFGLSEIQKNHAWLEKSPYVREKKAIGNEIGFLVGLDPIFLQNFYFEVLKTFWEVLFQIEAYTNPHQDLSNLYAKIFNHCFKQGDQKGNPLYLINENISLRPFCNFHHAVSSVELLGRKKVLE